MNNNDKILSFTNQNYDETGFQTTTRSPADGIRYIVSTDNSACLIPQPDYMDYYVGYKK